MLKYQVLNYTVIFYVNEANSRKGIVNLLDDSFLVRIYDKLFNTCKLINKLKCKYLG